jgi:hypothetical protein
MDIHKELEAADTVIDHNRPFKVEVIYNGVSKPFEVKRDELVKKLLDEALAAFGPIQNPHTMSLYKGGKELKDEETLKQAGVEPRDRLLLRPSEVKGGK